MAKNRILTAYFSGSHKVKTSALYQYDYGQVLRFNNLSLPAAYEVHFSNTDSSGNATTVIGGENGVLIPDAYLETGLPVFAWVFLHDTETDGETEYKVEIPVTKRAKPTNEQPTPVQQDVITQTIAALNAAVEQADALADQWENMSAIAESLPEGSEATAEYSDGVLSLGIPVGATGTKGDKGDPGSKGDPGYTPVRGVDYWTAADKQEIVDEAVQETETDFNELKSAFNDLENHVDTEEYKQSIADLVTVPSEIDDTAGSGDTDKTWSADKISGELAQAGTVQDVQVNGVSVLDAQGVANVPIAGDSPGVVRPFPTRGTSMYAGYITTYPASTDHVKAGGDGYKPLTPSTEHAAAFYGLAKAAGDTTQSQSSNAVGVYTDEAINAILTMLGVYNRILTPTGNTHTLLPCPFSYSFGEKAELTVTVTATSQYHFMFSSPSTAACVLTMNGITGTTGDTVEAGKTYEVDVWAGIALVKEIEVTAV